MGAKVLLIEKDRFFVQQLLTAFRAGGFCVVLLGGGECAQEVVAEETPDLVVLDKQSAGFSGRDFCRQMRRNQNTRNIAIIMLSSLGEEADVIRGLESGADHYMVKPCSAFEVVARARGILSRTNPARVAAVLTAAGLQLNRDQHRVLGDGGDIELGSTEFRLLEFLMENQDRILTRSQILDGVWGRDADMNERTVDVHIARLRKALGRSDYSRLIRTVRSMGYALETKRRPFSHHSRDSVVECILTQ